MHNRTKLIDLSHTIFDGLITYKGLPAPIICDFLSRENSKAFYEEGTEFQIGKIEMVTNTGTYLDCPFHRYENGKDLSEILLDQVADLEAVTIDARGISEVGISFFQNMELSGKAVLIHTGWSSRWNTPEYFEKHPYVSASAAEFLAENGAVLVGIDSHNIDDTSKKTRPVHSILLGKGVLVVEHLCNLASLPARDYRFSAVPPKIKGAGTFAVRAFASIAS